jgi:transposase
LDKDQGLGEGANAMLIIGCDFHPDFQQIAMLDRETGEVTGLRLQHPEPARQFYAALEEPALVGMESSGFSGWFERMLEKLGHQLWMGDAARIRASVVRRQKTDVRDAEHILTLLIEDRFPKLWVPTMEERDVRQLLLHRHHLVRSRTQVKNQLQALALNQGMRKKRQLWTEAGRELLQKLVLDVHTAARRDECLQRLDYLDQQIRQLNLRVAEEAGKRCGARLLMTHPGVGVQTALAFVLTIGPVERFANAKKVASYVGLIPAEYSSGGKQRLGRISKQGSPLLRFLLVEAAQSAARHDPELKRMYVRLCLRRSRGQAKVAVARRLATKLYWMLRSGKTYAQLKASGAGEPESFRDA